jgi:hypothetical protein
MGKEELDLLLEKLRKLNQLLGTIDPPESGT